MAAYCGSPKSRGVNGHIPVCRAGGTVRRTGRAVGRAGGTVRRTGWAVRRAGGTVRWARRAEHREQRQSQ